MSREGLPRVPSAGDGAGVAQNTNTSPPADVHVGEKVLHSPSFTLKEGVRSIYVRHKGIEGDGVGMARELAGRLAVGNGRGEFEQVGELKFMARKLHPFWKPIPDAEPGEEEPVIDPKDKISTKAAISITAMSGRNGLTQVQYDTFHSIVQVILKSAVIVVIAILTQFYMSSFEVAVPDHLVAWITASVMKLQPFYHRSHVNRLLNESLEKLKVKGVMIVFFETVRDKKIKKRKRSKRKRSNANLEHSSLEHETVAADPFELTGKYTVTQAILPGDSVQREVAHPATEAAFFSHVYFDSEGVPHDKPRSKSGIEGDEEGLGRCDFVDTPFWANRQELFGRLANFGAMADSAAPQVQETIEPDGHRVGNFRAKLFIQDSKLRLDMGGDRELLDLTFERDAAGTVKERIVIHQGAIDVIVRGEPFIGSARTITNDILRVPEFAKFYLPGDALWEVDLCDKELPPQSRGSKRRRSSASRSETEDDVANMITSMKQGFREHRAFVRFTTRTQDHNQNDSRSNYSLVLMDNNRQRQGDKELPFNQLILLSIPEGWRQGDLRPITGEPPPKNYMAHGMGPDGIPEVHAPLGLYSDDTSASHWTNEKIGGIYGLYPAYDPENRTSSLAIRCFGAATNKVQSDAVIECCVENLNALSEVGKVVYTYSHGKVRVFLHLVYHICDFPQSAASTDAMGHAAHAHCSICGARVNKKAEASYADQSCSADLSLTRSDARTAALKERLQNTASKTEVSNQLNYLGMSKEVLETPMNILQKRFERHGEEQWPRSFKAAYSPFRLYSDCAKESGRYDSHQCSVSAIDHLIFCGCGADSLEFQFDMLPNDSVRIEFSDKIVEACKLSGLPHPSAVIKQSASHSEGYVNSMGVGDVAACTIMASICLTSMEDDDVEVLKESYAVINGMNAIACIIYHTARPTTSTLLEAKQLKNEAQRLVDTVATYMELLSSLAGNRRCKRAAVKFINKPNLHRLLEFAFFWWPAIGFAVIHIAELIFEKYHQMLKQYAARTTNKRFLGFEIMQKMRLDECLKYIIASQNMAEKGPMRIFSWPLGFLTSMVWKVVKRLLSSSAKFTDEDAPEVNFMAIPPDRQWIGKGTFSRTRAGLILTSGPSQERATRFLSQALLGRKHNFHESYEFDCLTMAEFGKAASYHHQLTRGYFVTGTTDVETCKENLSTVGGNEFIIPRRAESMTESDSGKSFAKHRFTMVISEIWRVLEQQHGGATTESVFVRGIPLFERTKPMEKSGFKLWDAATFYVWKELDCSCRRIAGFPWSGEEDDGSDGGAIIESLGYEYTRTNASVSHKFVLLHEKEGYPSRRG